MLDVGSAKEHAAGHVPGAWFAPRAYLAEALAKLPVGRDVVITSPDGYLAQWAAQDWAALTGGVARVLEGGYAA